MESQVARDARPHRQAMPHAGEKRGELQRQRLGVGKDQDIVALPANPARQAQPLPPPIIDNTLHSQATMEMGIPPEERHESLGQHEIDPVPRLGQSPEQRRGEDGVAEMIAAEDEDVTARFDACPE